MSTFAPVFVLASAAVLGASGFLALPFGRWPRLADRLAFALLALGSGLGLAGAVLALQGERPPLLDVPWSLPWGRFSLEIDAVGSSRVDLQACKLEYSIVSPK